MYPKNDDYMLITYNDQERDHPEAIDWVVRKAKLFAGKIVYSKEDKFIMPGTEILTGIDEPLGAGVDGNNRYNTATTVRQMTASLALSPNSSDILERLASVRSDDVSEFLVKKQALGGVKALDLGCGIPTYARVARAMGATVYTVDHYLPATFSEEDQAFHIVSNITDKNASETIKEAIGDDLYFVTASTLSPLPMERLKTPKDKDIERIALDTLMSGGVYYKFDIVSKIGVKQFST